MTKNKDTNTEPIEAVIEVQAELVPSEVYRLYTQALDAVSLNLRQLATLTSWSYAKQFFYKFFDINREIDPQLMAMASEKIKFEEPSEGIPNEELKTGTALAIAQIYLELASQISQAITSELAVANTGVPDKPVFVHDKVSRVISDPNFSGNRIEVDCDADPKGKKIIMFSIDENAPLEPLSFWDNVVLKLTYSMWMDGFTDFTATGLYKTIFQETNKRVNNPAFIKRIQKSISVLSNTRMGIDFEKSGVDLPVDGDGNQITRVTDTVICPVDMVEKRIKGTNKKVTCYSFRGDPYLFQYWKAKNQHQRIDRKYFQVPNMGKYTLLLTFYLLDKVLLWRNIFSANAKLNYETIAEDTGINISDREKKSQLKNNVIDILTYWSDPTEFKPEDRLVRSFELRKKGTKDVGFTCKVKPTANRIEQTIKQARKEKAYNKITGM